MSSSAATARWRRLISTDFVARDLRIALAPWVLARALVLGALWVSRFLADKLPVTARTQGPKAGLFAYDGGWYRDIAERGYSALPHQGLRFFPLYPLLGRWLGAVFLDHTAVALVVIANGGALVFAAMLHRLVLRETGDAGIAARSAWIAALLPAAMCLVLSYAESLLMLAAVGMFLSMRSRRWLPAAAFGVAAGLSRPVGMLLVVPAAIEAYRLWRDVGGRERVARLVAVASPAVGCAVYLAWVGAVFGDPLLPFSVQSRHDLRGASIDPITHVIHSVRDVLNGDRFGAGLHLVWLALFAALIVVIARRLPASYTAYAVVSLLLATTASNISSFDRYAFSTIPFVIAIAMVTRRDVIDRIVVVAASGGLVAYSVLAFYKLYVP
jgi:hypothetical protein